MTEREILEYIVEHEDCNDVTCSGKVKGRINYGKECPLRAFCYSDCNREVRKTSWFRLSHCVIDEAQYELDRLKGIV